MLGSGICLCSARDKLWAKDLGKKRPIVSRLTAKPEIGVSTVPVRCLQSGRVCLESRIALHPMKEILHCSYSCHHVVTLLTEWIDAASCKSNPDNPCLHATHNAR